jgi:hypothetical protein
MRRLREYLGPLGIAALALLAGAALFFLLAVKPLQERALRLERELTNQARPSPERLKVLAGGVQATRVAAFYRFFDRVERTDEWLAKLYGIATANGLELRVGEYRRVESAQRLERYRIGLPVAGNYAQVRSFLEAALAEIPVLSLDQASFRRKAINDTRIEADLVFTLHRVRE